MNGFIIERSEQEIRREKDKARELRKSQWWKNRVAKGICHWCGGQFPPADLTMDHIVPIIRGGMSSRGNVVPACKECNSRKKYLLPMEWDEYLKEVKGQE
jgi:5-methylcytosine-specific restriction endonuclease McrA